jgi:hypothetical protein
MSDSDDTYDNESITAQDVVDALRLALIAQGDPVERARLVCCLLEFAPETTGNRGVELVMRLVTEATLRLELVDH